MSSEFQDVVDMKKEQFVSHSEERASSYILITKANEINYFLNLFDKIFYMFRTGPLSIIRSRMTHNYYVYTVLRYS